MASLYRQQNSDNWWIRYTKDGRQCRESTGTADKDKALLQLREVELILGQQRISGTVSQTLARAIQSQTVRPAKLAAVFENRRKHVAERTQDLYKSRDRQFLDWLRLNHPTVTMVSEVTATIVRTFLDSISDKFAARTHNGYLRRLRSVFHSSIKDGFAVDNPTEGIDFISETDSPRRLFAEDELCRLFSTVTGEVRLLATIGLYAGAMRMSDIVALTWQSVDLKRDTIRWRMSKRRGKPMEIAIHPRLKKELVTAHEQATSSWVLPSFSNNVGKASEAFRQTLVKAGLKKDNRLQINRRYEARRRERAKAEQAGKQFLFEPVKRQKHELDFHSLRYNFVSILKTQGCPEAIARSIMGHSSVEVSAIYTHIDADSERKWVTALPDITSHS